ncbi:hypothetical protein EDM68_02695 [Candidatus Uhrbacteria bacterium]|nr:MAG: hypothetical protein EDM68_02695 [Candidatus Uhrbacteria bacterium]
MNRFVIRSLAVVAGLSLMGAGCNPFARVEQRVGERVAEGLIERGLGGDASVDLGGGLPADFPTDVPRYPDAEYVSAVYLKDQNIAIANFKTKDEPQAVTDWFDRELRSAGFIMDENIAKLGLFRVYNKGTVKITLQTQRPEDGDRTTVSVQRVDSTR